MNNKDIDNYIDRYTSRFKEYGYSPETLGWGVHGKQDVRFEVLSEIVLKNNLNSVLDVGCGFADLYSFLKKHHWKGTYTGTEIVPILVAKAKDIHPGINILQEDIFSDAIPKADVVIASGIFNAWLIHESNLQHIERTLTKMFDLCEVAVCVDFMSTQVDFQKEGSWHTDPVWAYQLAKKLSRRVVLRNDYMPYEFSMIIYKDDSLSPENTFKGFNI